MCHASPFRLKFQLHKSFSRLWKPEQMSVPAQGSFWSFSVSGHLAGWSNPKEANSETSCRHHAIILKNEARKVLQYDLDIQVVIIISIHNDIYSWHEVQDVPWGFQFFFWCQNPDLQSMLQLRTTQSVPAQGHFGWSTNVVMAMVGTFGHINIVTYLLYPSNTSFSVPLQHVGQLGLGGDFVFDSHVLSNQNPSKLEMLLTSFNFQIGP